LQDANTPRRKRSKLALISRRKKNQGNGEWHSVDQVVEEFNGTPEKQMSKKKKLVPVPYQNPVALRRRPSKQRRSAVKNPHGMSNPEERRESVRPFRRSPYHCGGGVGRAQVIWAKKGQVKEGERGEETVIEAPNGGSIFY